MSAARRRAPKQGRFLVLEGIDGAGTTTQSKRLAEALQARGERVLTTAQPSTGPIGVMLRQALSGRLRGFDGPMDPVTLALLFAADRTDHVAQVIAPALAAGTTVICDRYVLSSMAYQGLSLPLQEVARLNAHARRPDLTLFLDVPPKVAGHRRDARGGRAELFEADALQRRIDGLYREAIALRRSEEHIAWVDGRLPVEQVTEALLACIDGGR